MSKDKKLQHINEEEVIRKSQAGQGLTLAEAAVRYGIPYSTLRRMRRKGLPLVEERLFETDFTLWRQQQAGLARSSSPGTSARPTRGTLSKPCEYLR